MSFKIRKANYSDLPYIYNICLKTGKSGSDASDYLYDKFSIAQYFAAPYLHFDIDSCLILENEGIPTGYIIGCSNTSEFNKWMNEEWLPELRKKYPPEIECKSPLESFIVKKINSDIEEEDYFKDYPSHLHIDLLETAQGKGFGKKLLYDFFKLMKTKNVKGLHLGVGLNNKNAIEFYKKTGFDVIREEDGALIMGIKF